MKASKSICLFWLVFLMSAQIGTSFINMKDTTTDLFYGPTSTIIHWAPLYPPVIPCNKRPIPEQDRLLPKKMTGTKLAHITNSTAHGYLCTKAIWTVTCAEGFFGGRTLTHKIHPTLPSLSECQDTVRLYKTNHHTGFGFPVERCGWMGTNTESAVNIQISESFIHVDPYSQKYIDARFIGGSCGEPPCKLNTLDTLWMNTSTVPKMCLQRTKIDIFIKNMNTTEFYSNDLVATTLDGACHLKVCGERGIRLVTGEWMNIMAKTTIEADWFKTLENCPTLSEIQDVSLKGIMNHMEGQLLMDDSYRLCIEAKEKFMTGEVSTRFDIARIAPAVPIGGPVYRKNGDRVEVGYSEYSLLRSPDNALVGSNPDFSTIFAEYKMKASKSICLFWLVFLMSAQIGTSFINMKDTTTDLFYGPTSTIIHWAPLYPPVIPCNKRPIPEQDRLLPKKMTGTKLAHITNSTAHGYLCTKAIWTVTCAEGFFGGRTLTHKIHPTLPSLSECQDAVRLYKTNHHTGFGFPVERCGWMGTNTESAVNIQISESFIHVDPYSQKYIDARFIGGSCGEPPCKLNTLDTLWMNTSTVPKMCLQRTKIDIFIKNMNTTEFYSNDLVATTLDGACHLKVCGERGIRLVTGEWMNIMAKTTIEADWFKTLENCPTLSEIQDVSLKGIMNHMEGQLLMDDSYRLCIEAKEKFMTGEGTTLYPTSL
ncbi:AAEL007844-PA [Aedes aegypti]|uniref:AAEL007844-PA n=1 Tax=Aedes aegypti TaxID=7159 RepID=Q170M5_AEDAE|nr:AAEL007844-PA [Aedes aegypti]